MPDPILVSMLRINRHRLHGLKKVLCPYGYKGTMHLILGHVCRHPGASQEQIACTFALDKTTVARDAKKLEDLGHIARSTVPEDRRRYALYPTEAGQRMYGIICDCNDDIAATMRAGLTDAERDQLAELLSRIEKTLEK